jgi:hypothetical protein
VDCSRLCCLHCMRHLSTQLVTTHHPWLYYYSLVTDYLHLFFQDTYLGTYYILLVRKASTRSSNFHSAETPAVCLWLTSLARFGCCCWLKEGRIQARCVCVPPLSYYVIMRWNNFWSSIHCGPSMISLGKTFYLLRWDPSKAMKIHRGLERL